MNVYIPEWITYGFGILFHIWAMALFVVYMVDTRTTLNNWAYVPFIGLIFFYSWVIWG